VRKLQRTASDPRRRSVSDALEILADGRRMATQRNKQEAVMKTIADDTTGSSGRT
jgi:hypothetical protein